MHSISASCLLLGYVATTSAFQNMNGEYLTTSTPNASGSFNTKWSEYPNGGVEYFEVYMGPMTSLYAQVWWKTLPEVPIPDDIVKRFNGKGMAIVGYETDAVRKTPQGDVSVPINMAYNHHHDVYLTGKHSKMSKVPYDHTDPTLPACAAQSDPYFLTIPVETSKSPHGLPTSLHLADGNGGEYRKSYHGFSAPVAYVIDSPQSVHVNPMFIDTWNRDEMNISGGSKFVAGPMPKQNLAPKNASYSGLLECPLTDRIQKIFPGGKGGFDSTYTPTVFNCDSKITSCIHVIGSAKICFDAARVAFGSNTTVETSEGASDTTATGCTMTYDGTGRAKAFFNTRQTEQCCGANVASVKGTSASLVDIEMMITNDTVTITLAGPENVWFGVGFFAQAMEDKPYAIIVDGSGNVSERVLASHMGSAANPGGTLLAPTVKVVGSSTTAGKRTVVLSRPSLGATKQHVSFTLQDIRIPFINAIGSSSILAYHANKTASSISLWPTANQPVCLCEQPAAPFGSAKGTIKYLPTGEEFGFINACMPEPRESVLADRNPTCDVRAYAGGLQVCKHMWSLLDADQEQPWPDQPLVYYQKYRFYYQEYNPALHVIALPRAVWAIGAFIGEYDVPQCEPGTPVEDCTHEIWGVVTPGGDNLHIAAIHFHCHAPTCLAMEIVNNHTGELLCRQEPIYGGTGKVDLPKFDEPGYILQPPCLWGYEPGLEPMPKASGVSFMIRAITNSTYGHRGEMAFPEIALVPWNTTANRPQPGYPYTEVVKMEWQLLKFQQRGLFV